MTQRTIAHIQQIGSNRFILCKGEQQQQMCISWWCSITSLHFRHLKLIDTLPGYQGFKALHLQDSRDTRTLDKFPSFHLSMLSFSSLHLLKSFSLCCPFFNFMSPSLNNSAFSPSSSCSFFSPEENVLGGGRGKPQSLCR